MASVSAFNDMLEQFIGELATTFPEEGAIASYKAKVDLMRAANPRLILDAFMDSIAPFTDLIMKRDDSFFTKAQGLFADIPLAKHWTPELSDNTKGAIWQYLQTLNMLGSTIRTIPAEALSQIETVAEQCASSMGDNPQPQDMMAGISSIMSSMGGLGGLFGGPTKNIEEQ